MTRTIEAADRHHMKAALGLARRGLGRAYPNPAVGCILTDPGGYVLARGWTQPGGRPHAEAEAIARAGATAPGATAYVTLEPCHHHGKTPPCSEALINAGIKRCVVATLDADPRTRGLGVARLEDAGVHVEFGLMEDEARALNKGFFLRIDEGRPMVTLKCATTLDGRIATRTGSSKWITGEHARAHAHRLRAEHDAILVGVGTAIADDPSLTCRLPGMEDRSPVRVVLDTHLRLPLMSRLVATAKKVPTWIICCEGTEGQGIYEDHGVSVITCPMGPDEHVDISAALAELAGRGITRLLVEGGGAVSSNFLALELVDEIAWFRASSLVGGDGVPAVSGLGINEIADAATFERTAVQILGSSRDGDVLETFVRKI